MTCNADVYVPGIWRCALCKFVLCQSNLNASDGTITARDEPGEKCPNDGSPLWRVTWKQQAEELDQRCEEAIVEASRLRMAVELFEELWRDSEAWGDSATVTRLAGKYAAAIREARILSDAHVDGVAL